MSTLDNESAMALKASVATRGKHKGKLLAKAPASNTLAYAAWQGAMMVCNPYKVSIGGCMFMSPEQRRVREAVTAALEAVAGSHRLDRDRTALESWGVW